MEEIFQLCDLVTVLRDPQMMANKWLSLFARIALVRLPEPALAARRCA